MTIKTICVPLPGGATGIPDPLQPGSTKDPRLSPWLVPPENSDPFDRTGSATLAPGASATLISIDLAGNELARLSGIGLAIDPTVVPNTDITFRLRISGVLTRDFGSIRDFIGVLEQPRQIFFKVTELGATIEMIVINASGVTTYNVAATLQGWVFTAG